MIRMGKFDFMNQNNNQNNQNNMNNQNMNNQQNNYNQQVNNGMQPNMNQQMNNNNIPPRMNQPMNQQLPPQMMNRNGQLNQSPMPNNTNQNPRGGNRGFNKPNNDGNKEIITIVMSIAGVALLLIFLLNATGVIKLKDDKVNEQEEIVEKKDKVEDAIPVEKKEEVKNPDEVEVSQYCTALDGEGKYNTTEIQSREDKIAQLPDGTSVSEVWNILEGVKFCRNNACYWYKPGSEHTVFAYSCNLKQIEEAKFEDLWEKIEADSMLDTACKNMDENGNVTNVIIEGMTCHNFTCTLTYNDKTYRKDCEK